MKKGLVLICVLMTALSCATKVWVTNPSEMKGRRIGIVGLNLFHEKTQEPLPNLSQTVAEGFYPYLHEAGFTIVNFKINEAVKEEDAFRIGDSLKVDYILVGSGAVGFTLGDPFIHDFAVKLINIKTREIELMGTFSGAGVEPIGIARKVGKKIVKCIRQN